tara:strand:+ start:180 stop:314 length:135 start_codon:yes stop_codon:yes gene_type:complete
MDLFKVSVGDRPDKSLKVSIGDRPDKCLWVGDRSPNFSEEVVCG